MRHFMPIVFLLNFPLLVCCQSSAESRPLFGLKWTPTSLFNPNTNTLMFGAECWFSKKYYAQAEYGFPLWKWPKEGAEYRTDWHFQKMKFGLRQTLNEDGRSVIGFDVFYIPQSYTHYNGTSPYEPRIHIVYEEAVIEKDAYGAMMVFGLRWPLSGQFFWEAYTGLGMKVMDVVHVVDLDKATLASGPPPNSYLFFSVNSYDKTPGKRYLPYLDLGIKLGLLYKKTKAR